MAIFSIQCTTCRARLSVQKAAAIGQILACPHCGSMVAVEDPRGVDSAAAGAAAGAVVPPVSTPVSPQPASSSSATTVRPPADIAPPPAESPSSADIIFEQAARMVEQSPSAAQTVTGPMPSNGDALQGSSSEQVATGAGSPADSTASAASPVVPDAVWTSPAEQLWRRVALYGTATVTGILLAMALGGVVVSWWGRNGTDVDLESASVQEPIGDAEAAHLSVEDDVADSDRVATDSTDPDSTDPDSIDPDSTDPVGPDPDTVQPESGTTVVATDETNAAQPPADSADASPADPSTEPTVTAEFITSFRTGLFDDPIPAPAFEASVIPTVTPASDHAPVDVAARLEDVIPGIEFESIPLIEFLRFVSQLTTIPISVSPTALTHVGQRLDVPVSVKQSATNVSTLLNHVLADLRLGFQAADHGLLVIRQPPEEGGLRTHRYPMSDLGGQDPQTMEELVDLVLLFIEPTSWQAAGGPGRWTSAEGFLVVDQTDSAHFNLLFLCEKLRVARGQPTLSRFSEVQFQLDTRTQRLRRRLQRPVNMNFVQPTQFVEIVQRLEMECDLSILVDWQQVGQLGWTPLSTATMTATDVELGAALDQWLTPMGLAWRAANGRTLQITTQTALLEKPETEFYALAHIVDSAEQGAQLLREIRDAFGAQKFSAGGGEWVLHFDALSRTLIARVPQYQQRVLTERLSAGR